MGLDQSCVLRPWLLLDLYLFIAAHQSKTACNVLCRSKRFEDTLVLVRSQKVDEEYIIA